MEINICLFHHVFSLSKVDPPPLPAPLSPVKNIPNLPIDNYTRNLRMQSCSFGISSLECAETYGPRLSLLFGYSAGNPKMMFITSGKLFILQAGSATLKVSVVVRLRQSLCRTRSLPLPFRLLSIQLTHHKQEMGSCIPEGNGTGPAERAKVLFAQNPVNSPSLLAKPKSIILIFVPVVSTQTMFSGLRSR